MNLPPVTFRLPAPAYRWLVSTCLFGLLLLGLSQTSTAGESGSLRLSGRVAAQASLAVSALATTDDGNASALLVQLDERNNGAVGYQVRLDGDDLSKLQIQLDGRTITGPSGVVLSSSSGAGVVSQSSLLSVSRTQPAGAETPVATLVLTVESN